MRQATFVITSEQGGLHPADEAIAADPAIVRRSIRDIGLLDDGTCVVLYAFSGDADRGIEILREQPTVHEFEVAHTGENSGLAYVHSDATEAITGLLTISRRLEILVRTPIECLDGGGVRPVVVGTDETIQRAAELVPDSLHLSLQRIGPYEPRPEEDFFATLTERQQDILALAMREGYYEVPRRTTHDELAAKLGLSRSTVGEHLRKIESRALAALTPRTVQ